MQHTRAFQVSSPKTFQGSARRPLFLSADRNRATLQKAQSHPLALRTGSSRRQHTLSILWEYGSMNQHREDAGRDPVVELERGLRRIWVVNLDGVTAVPLEEAKIALRPEFVRRVQAVPAKSFSAAGSQ